MRSIETEIFVPGVSPKRNRRWFWLLLFVIFGAGLWWAWETALQTNYGRVTTSPVRETVNRDTPKTRVIHTGKYFSFSYPSDFQQLGQADPVNYPLLERVVLSRGTVNGRKIVVLYQDIAGGPLGEYAAFRIRQDNPSQYFEETIEKRGYRATVFSKAESVFEVTAFLPHERHILSVAVTSPLGLSGLREELFEMLDSLTFVPK